MSQDYQKYEDLPQRSGMGRGDGDRRNGSSSARRKIDAIKSQNSDKYKELSAVTKAKADEYEGRQSDFYQNFEKLFSAYRASCSKEDEDKLSEFCQQNNLRLGLYREVAKDERSEIARIAFNGTVERPRGGYSENYKKLVDNPLKYAQDHRNPEEYKLEDCGLWQVMKQFPEFASIEKRIVSGMAKAGVPPEILPELNMSNLKHLLFTQCGLGASAQCAKIFPQMDTNGNIIRDFRTQKPLTTSAKKRNTIQFIENHPEFAEVMMRIPGANREYVKELVNQMKQGNTDMTQYLAKHPEWKNQMAVNVHHIVNIKDVRLLAEQGRPLGDINSPDNMCVMGCGTLEQVMTKQNQQGYNREKLAGVHGAMHNYDTTFRNSALYQRQKGDSYEIPEDSFIARVEPGNGVCCMLAVGEGYAIVDEQRKERDLERQKNMSCVAKGNFNQQGKVNE